MKKLLVYSALLLLNAIIGSAVFAIGNEFSFRIMPVWEAPLAKTNFSPGIGAAASLDWAFLPYLGVSAGGAVSRLGINDGSTFNALKADAGIFYRMRPFERWTFRGDIGAGIYQYQWDGYHNIRPKISGSLSADFHLTPYLSIFGTGIYSWQMFSDAESINTIGIGLGLRINLSELMRGNARVQGAKTDQQDIFPVSYTWYRENPLATFYIINEEPTAITDLSLRLIMDQYLGQPVEFARLAHLAPGAAVSFPVTAQFNESVLNLTENTLALGRVQINYRSLGMKKETTFHIEMPVYHRNAMSWDDDRRAASFVSPQDPAARLFARHTASIADSVPPNSVPRNVRYAGCVFEALAVYKIQYVFDPLASYSKMSDNAENPDSLNYPYQTLYYRGGDCDDLSILFCSMLESLKIETAFITVPGHIFMAFNTDLKTGTVLPPGLRAGDLIEYSGSYWMPIEVTVSGEGFYFAWRMGVNQWRDAGEEGRFYPMKENWAVFPAVSVPVAGNWLPPLPDEDELKKAFTQALNKLQAVFSPVR